MLSLNGMQLEKWMSTAEESLESGKVVVQSQFLL